MEFRAYVRSLDKDDRAAYAERAGTTVAYLPQLMAKRPFKIPSEKLMWALADASEGNVTIDEVLAHFFRHPRVKGPRRQVAKQVAGGRQ